MKYNKRASVFILTGLWDFWRNRHVERIHLKRNFWLLEINVFRNVGIPVVSLYPHGPGLRSRLSGRPIKIIMRGLFWQIFLFSTWGTRVRGSFFLNGWAMKVEEVLLKKKKKK